MNQPARENRTLKIEPLEHMAFEAFGDVIELPHDGGRIINDGTAIRHDRIAMLELTADGGQPVLDIFHVKPVSLPFECQMLERHPISSQAFVPIGECRFLVVVAPAEDDSPDANVSRAFITNGRQGVNYHPGVWHHPILALGEETDFVMIGRAEDGYDCDVVSFARGITISIPRVDNSNASV